MRKRLIEAYVKDEETASVMIANGFRRLVVYEKQQQSQSASQYTFPREDVVRRIIENVTTVGPHGEVFVHLETVPDGNTCYQWKERFEQNVQGYSKLGVKGLVFHILYGQRNFTTACNFVIDKARSLNMPVTYGKVFEMKNFSTNELTYVKTLGFSRIVVEFPGDLTAFMDDTIETFFDRVERKVEVMAFLKESTMGILKYANCSEFSYQDPVPVNLDQKLIEMKYREHVALKPTDERSYEIATVRETLDFSIC